MIYNEVATLFSELPQIKAVTLAGSAVAPIRDSHSDYDIYIYHDAPIPREIRSALLAKLGENPKVRVGASFFEEGDEVHFENAPYLDLMYRDVNWIAHEVEDVWLQGHGRLGYSTCFIFNLVNSKILFDRGDYFKNLQASVMTPYPEKLRDDILFKNLTEINGDLEAPYLKQIKLAILRDDLVSMNHRVAALLASYFDILFAYSRVLHPGEKKLERYIVEYGVRTPEDFTADLHAVLEAASDRESLVGKLETLMEHLKELLESEK